MVLSAVAPRQETLRVRLERSWLWPGLGVRGVVEGGGVLVGFPRVFLPFAAGLCSRRPCARFPHYKEGESKIMESGVVLVACA